jgi:plasmid replication initiation protein
MSQAQEKGQFDPALLADVGGDVDPYDDPARAEMYELKWQRHLEWLIKGVTEQLGTLHRALALETVTRGNDSEAAVALREQIKALEAKKAEYQAEMGVTADTVNSEAPAAPDPGREKKLLPVRNLNRDFFLADLVDYAFKDDTASMEAPIFSLATKPDLTQWKWASKDGKRRMEVTPSILGRATIHDKDVLIYVTSQMTEALNRERSDTSSRKVRFTVHDYLMTTNRHTSGREYEAFQVALRRLSGTRIYTNIETGDVRIKHDFGIIDSWEIVEKSPLDERMIAVEIELSEWLYNAIQAKEVLTLHPDYFRLRKPTERRIYELARKHCGHQAEWTIGLSLLHEKSGSRASLYEFHEAVKDMAESDHMPDYRMHVSKAARVADVQVKFYTRDMARYARSQAKRLG